jgi:sterol desaturase/sphingolipid hydroxylase (fatty acid hydroxylase superfamily)
MGLFEIGRLTTFHVGVVFRMFNTIQKYRLSLSIGVLLSLLAWETASPFFGYFRGRPLERGRHAFRNLAFGALNALLIPVGFVGAWSWAAALSKSRNVGLLHLLRLPQWAHAIATVLALDCWTYWWHRWNHTVPLLWRFHRTHHSDPQMDVTTSTRFHIGEMAISNILRIPLIFLLGAEIWELAVYEMLALAVVMFHHADVGLPKSVDRILRIVLVTPAMHKVHNSRLPVETNSNYTSLLSLWDRLFQSFRLRDEPREIHFGLDGFDDESDQSIVGMVRTPLPRISNVTSSQV